MTTSEIFTKDIIMFVSDIFVLFKDQGYSSIFKFSYSFMHNQNQWLTFHSYATITQTAL